MKEESEKLEKLISRCTWKNRRSEIAITLMARESPLASSPEILFDGTVDQVWVKIASLENPSKNNADRRWRKEDNDRDERRHQVILVQGLRRKIGRSYDERRSRWSNTKNTIYWIAPYDNGCAKTCPSSSSPLLVSPLDCSLGSSPLPINQFSRKRTIFQRNTE